MVKFKLWYVIDEHRWLGHDAKNIEYVQHKGTKMFVLSAIAVFSCVKIAESVFSSNEMSAKFKTSSQARFLRAHAEAQGSHTWGF
ncbi:MAG: hypothetical protein P1U36_02290 [Legionellaceae bacterium]|nr:hypothetical protein [Legionellaceae bacterium]